jgi:hypothetical protein
VIQLVPVTAPPPRADRKKSTTWHSHRDLVQHAHPQPAPWLMSQAPAASKPAAADAPIDSE